PAAAYPVYVLIPIMSWWMYRTHSGLALRAIGENPAAAVAAGIRAARIQFAAILFGGLMGGVARGFLVIAQAGTFSEGVSAGRGCIEIVIVVLVMGLGFHRSCDVSAWAMETSRRGNRRACIWSNHCAPVSLSNNGMGS